jgi:hypothetical protein
MSDGIQAIAAVTHDIDPNLFNQRDVDWLKEVYSKIKGGLTKIFAAYNRSGKQNGDDDADVDFKSDVKEVLEKQCGAWASMSSMVTKGTWPDAMAYAFVLLNEDDFNHIVRLLGTVGRDESKGGDAEEERRKRRKLSKDKKNRSASAGAGLGQIIAAEGAKEEKRALLHMMMQWGSDEDKIKAMAEIRKCLQETEKNVSSSSSASSSSSSSSSSSGLVNDSLNSSGINRSSGHDDSDDDEDNNDVYDD